MFTVIVDDTEKDLWRKEANEQNRNYNIIESLFRNLIH